VHAPIIQNMIESNAYPVIGLDTLDEFTAANRHVVLFFTELMKPVPETADVAVILPELERAFDRRFAVAVVAWEAQRDLQRRFRFTKYPSLVFLRDGEYLGAISGVLDWADYLADVGRILAAEPSEPPPFVFPGQDAPSGTATEQPA
jgi:hydrogenase-1 operon protein HyaE